MTWAIGNILGNIKSLEDVNIQDTFNNISNVLNKYIVSPLNAFGFGGFVFDVEGETEVDISSDITDHYVLDNTAVQDHIAIKPTILRLQRYVGELIYTGSSDATEKIIKITQNLTVLDNLLPKISKVSKDIKDNLSNVENLKISDLTNIGSEVYNIIDTLNPYNTKQHKAFLFLKVLQQSRILVGVQTPFGFFPEMAIERVRIVQRENSKFISDIEITLKEIRKADTYYLYKKKRVPYGRNSLQQTQAVNVGKMALGDINNV